MSAAAPAWTSLAYRRLPIPAAAFEVLGLLAVVAAATLAFLAGWLSVNGAVVLTVALLLTLIVLSWIHLGQGRHPVFLFLCTLMLFQGGRLLAYCLGVERDPMQVALIGGTFNPSRETQAITLLCIVVSAICIYAPCRLKFTYVPPPELARVRKYLPYLYVVFFVALPFQIFKNYRYYEYAEQHGGYLFIYISRAKLAATVPIMVRLVTQIIPPAFVAVFVFEARRKMRALVTALYFASGSIILLLGQRSNFFVTVLTLWFLNRFRSQKKPSFVLLAMATAALLVVGVYVQTQRDNESDSQSLRDALVLPIDFVDLQGASLGVTEIGVQYRDLFAPNSLSYLTHELQNAFIANDASTYRHGKLLPSDMSMFINERMFALGNGVGSSYLAEAYILGGFIALVLVSLLLASALRAIYQFGQRAEVLTLGAMIFMDILWMPRGDLVTWVSALVRNLAALLALGLGWFVYSLMVSIRHDSDSANAATTLPS